MALAQDSALFAQMRAEISEVRASFDKWAQEQQEVLTESKRQHNLNVNECKGTQLDAHANPLMAICRKHCRRAPRVRDAQQEGV